MNLILNIETATEICSVALSNGEEIIDYRENSEGKSHASLLTVFIDEILKAHQTKVEDLSAVAISMGPGSYTGLRIGVSVAKGLCYAHNTPLLAISTLQIMVNQFIDLKGQQALNFPEHALLCPMIDARRHEVYAAMYDARGNIKVDKNFRTSRDKVFAAGDAAIGASLVVRAIFQGRNLARSVDNCLRKNK
jgi:tRNA threonylcarbamoyladenosine biosynthesis protein TsaB